MPVRFVAAVLAVGLSLVACSGEQHSGSSSDTADERGADRPTAALPARDVGYACGISAAVEGRQAIEADGFVGLTVNEANEKAEQERLTLRVEGEDGSCRKLPPPPTLPSVVRVYVMGGRVAVAARPTG